MNDGGSSLWSTRLWVGRWQTGDQAALGELARRFSPLLQHRIRESHGYRKLHDPESVEDIEQEVWTRVLGASPQAFTPSGTGSFVAWLAGVADNTMADLARRRSAVKRGGGQAPGTLDSGAHRHARPLPGAAREPTPTAQVRMAEFEKIAREILLERELQAWRWVALLGYTSEEAALGLHCSPAAVRSLLARSRRRLRDALEERRQRET